VVPKRPPRGGASRLDGATIPIPVLFIAGSLDLVLFGRGKEQLEPPMKALAPDLRGLHLIEGAGHWIQQERAEEVNRLLIEFLRESAAADSGR